MRSITLLIFASLLIAGLFNAWLWNVERDFPRMSTRRHAAPGPHIEQHVAFLHAVHNGKKYYSYMNPGHEIPLRGSVERIRVSIESNAVELAFLTTEGWKDYRLGGWSPLSPDCSEESISLKAHYKGLSKPRDAVFASVGTGQYFAQVRVRETRTEPKPLKGDLKQISIKGEGGSYTVTIDTTEGDKYEEFVSGHVIDVYLD